MSIHALVAPMFAGKTSELHSHYKACILAGNDALLISHSLDTRYSPHAPLNVSHDGVKSKCIRVAELKNLPLSVASHLFIDEGQFFPDLVEFCLAQRKAGKHVMVAGLRSDAEGKAWPQMSEIVTAHADKVTFKEAVCIVCKGKAMYTRKREVCVLPPPSGEGERIAIGSDEKYLPSCYNHLFDPPQISDAILQERMLLLKKSKETLFY